jgi:hypothetical protein
VFLLESSFHQKTQQVRKLRQAADREFAKNSVVTIHDNFKGSGHQILGQHLWQQQVDQNGQLNAVLLHAIVPSGDLSESQFSENIGTQQGQGYAAELDAAQKLEQELNQGWWRVILTRNFALEFRKVLF